MDSLSNLLTIAAISLLGAISPGPDFFIVVRNSLIYSRKVGFFTVLGLCLGLFIHLFYTLIGIGVLIAESEFLYHFIKYIGAAYLFYIGLTGWISSFKTSESMDISCVPSSQQISSFTALKQGFLTNLLNPKVAIFFISLFSQFIGENTPLFLKIGYAITNWSVSLVWFLFLSYLVTSQFFLKRIKQFRLYLDRVMGSALMLLSVKMVLL